MGDLYGGLSIYSLGNELPEDLKWWKKGKSNFEEDCAVGNGK